MSNNTYQGWSNYETWNAALYIENEYDLYQTKLEAYKMLDDISTLDAGALLKCCFPSGKTPDGAKISRVDLEEFTEWMINDRQEYNQYHQQEH